MWCDDRRRVEGPGCHTEGRAPPICLYFRCQVPKHEHFILIIVPGKNFELSDIPLKRISVLAKKRAADHSHDCYVQFRSWHFKTFRKELQKFMQKWIESKWWKERL